MDVNSTTAASETVIRATSEWMRKIANPSSANRFGIAAAAAIADARTRIARALGLDQDEYRVVFTSGATESNTTALHMLVNAFSRITNDAGARPSVVASAVEHKSVIETLHAYVAANRCDVVFVRPNIYGVVQLSAIAASLSGTTCVCCVMAANNETGAVNDIDGMADRCHHEARTVPMMTDITQLIGRRPIPTKADILTTSFHKFHGPHGIGALIIRRDLISGYHLEPLIYGSQEFCLRGGTENVAGIIGATVALEETMRGYTDRAAKLATMRQRLIDGVCAAWTCVNYHTLLKSGPTDDSETRVVILGPDNDHLEYTLPNVVLMSVLQNHRKFCNVNLRRDLDEAGFIVGIGSACLTSSPKASHVLDAIYAPPAVKRGVIRISFDETLTAEKIERFVAALKVAVGKNQSSVTQQ
jgi:cysteine desulfurase